MKTSNRRKRSAIAALSAIALWTSAAVAQEPRELSFGFRTGDDSVEIKVRGDEVEVLRNGEAAEASRFRRQGASVVWLDAKGRVRATVTLSPWGGNVHLQPEVRGRASLGLKLNRLSDALAEHLDVHPGDVLYVAEAVQGKAAAKAGVRKHDVLTRIDGRAPINQAMLQQVLRDKKPGDVLALEVRRGGDLRTIDVELEEEDGLNYGWFGDYAFPGALQSYGTAKDSYFDALRLSGTQPLFPDLLFSRDWTAPSVQLDLFDGFGNVETEAPPADRIKDIDERLQRLEELLKSLAETRKKSG